MATQVQLRRGTDAQVNMMTPAEGEVVVDMTNDRLSVGDGIRQGGFPIPNFSDIQKNSFTTPVVTGTGNAIILTLNPALLAYVGGTSFKFVATAANTGAVTVNINGLGVRSVISNSGLSALSSGDIVAGSYYELYYDGTRFLISSLGQSGGISGNVTAGTYPITLSGSGSSGVANTYTNVGFTYYIPYTGIVRGNMVLRKPASTGTHSARWVKNGSTPVGSVHSINASGADTAFTDSISVVAGDRLRVQISVSSGSGTGTVAGVYISIAEFFPSATSL